MTVTRALHLKRSLWNRLSSPMLRSKRLREAIREGLWSLSAVPGAGILIRVEPYCDAGHVEALLMGVVGVACTLPQNSPAWNCWSGDSPEASRVATPPTRMEVPPQTLLGFVSLKQGTPPATRPLSYRQLAPIQGQFLRGWYCMCVVCWNFWSWSIRKAPIVVKSVPSPPTCGLKKRELTPLIVTNAVMPWKLGTLARSENPLIFERDHAIGKKIGVFRKSLKS